MSLRLLPPFRQRGFGNVAGLGGYSTSANDYDGTNDYQTRGANLTGAADAKVGTFSCWLRLDGGDATTMLIMSNNTAAATAGIRVTRVSDNTLAVSARDTADLTVLAMATAGTFTAGASWIHILASWDLTTAAANLYINGVSDNPAPSTVNVLNIDYTEGDWSIGAHTGGASKFNGCLAEVFFHNTYLDITQAANLAKFRSPTGRPVFLGDSGELPLGVQPLIYARYGDASTNLGSGGNFTTTGALTACSTAP